MKSTHTFAGYLFPSPGRSKERLLSVLPSSGWSKNALFSEPSRGRSKAGSYSASPVHLSARRFPLVLLLLSAAVLFTACNTQNTDSNGGSGLPNDPPVEVDRDRLLSDLEYLASDELGGRKTGTIGNELAREFIEERFSAIGLLQFGDRYRQQFDHTHRGNGEVFEDAVNMIGYVEGTVNPGRYIALGAHYDHLGTVDEEIFNGADDNASGTSGLMAAAEWFAENPPENSILFIAFDAEEQGLGGAEYFVNHPVIPLDDVTLMVNMDMISNSSGEELYAVGTRHFPFLRPIVEESTEDAPISVLFGHDDPENLDQDDWTLASDHGPFHLAGIPFIYFGVEDHEHYHQPTDTFETIHPDFFYSSVVAITEFVREADRKLDEIREASGR